MSKLDDLTKTLVDIYTEKLSQQERDELVSCLQVLADDEKYNMFKNTFPQSGEYSIDKYDKHRKFFDAGATYKERCLLSGNRTGKTVAAVFEVTCHATGQYPDWWKGRRFLRPVKLWLGGDTATTCRDILQNKLLGNIGDFGSGMLPKDTIVETKTRRGTPDAMEIIRVRHITGGVSEITLKTYDQGRETWQGTEVDGVFLDEEAPLDVYSEALIRTMTTGGFTVLTFTPLQGVTDLVMSFLDNSQDTDVKYPKYVGVITWYDVPHLKEEEIEQMLAATPPQLREARSKGIPTVGTGLVYPVDPKNIVVDDFPIPKHYKKLFALDVGWNNTAAIWGALDSDNDVIYLYSEYKQGGIEGENMILVHSTAIKSRGSWIRGVIDPASRGKSQLDGETLFLNYKKAGLKIAPANNAVEAGIFEIYERMITGKLKIFKSCTQLLRELSLYHRDNKGKIVKTNDHLLDATRYLINAEKSMWSYPSQEQDRTKVVEMKNYMTACT